MQYSSSMIWMITTLALLITISLAPANATSFTITGGGSCVPVGSTTDHSIILSDIPQGLSGVNITIAISDPYAATITNVTFPDWAALHTTSSLPSDQIWLKMVDLQQKVNTGDLNVPICRISILARKGGNSIIAVTPVKVEDDIGGRYTLTPGQITLCTGDSTAGSQPQIYQISGTPIPTQTTYSSIISPVTTPSSISITPTQLPGTQPSAPVLQTQAMNSSFTPESSDTSSSPNATTETITHPLLTTRASLPIILPLISLIVSIVFLAGLERIKKK